MNVIAALDVPSHLTSQLERAAGESRHFELVVCSAKGDLMSELGPVRDRLSAIVVGDGADPVQTAQRAYQIDPAVSIVLLEPARRRGVVDAVRLSRSIDMDVTCADADGDTWVELVALAAARAGRRRQLEATIASLGAELAERREREAAHLAAEASSRLLEITLRSIGDAVIATDTTGHISFMNALATELTGWPAAEALGQRLSTVFQIVHEHSRVPVTDFLDRVARDGDAMHSIDEARLIARSSREPNIEGRLAPIRDDNGASLGVVVVFRDVAERKLAELRRQLLAEATEQLAASLRSKESLPEVARVLVPRFSDRARLELLTSDPSSRRSVSGQRGDREIVLPIVVRGRRCGFLAVGRDDSSPSFTSDDERFLAEIGARTAIALDNALLYEAEQVARQAADVANRAKDEFLATISHELRTPLNAMLGWSRMLKDGDLAPERRARAIAIVERNAVAMSQLVEDLLDVSQIVMGKMRLQMATVDLVPVVAAAVHSVEPAATARDVTLGISSDEGLGPVLGDTARLQQVVWNLVSNAVKFTPAGGRVDVSVKQRANVAQIEVRDTGRGIEASFVPFVFEAFRQADGSTTRKHGGLGLGLAIGKQLIELQGGQIRVASEGLGRGATFTVELPLAHGRSAPVVDAMPPSSASNAQPSSRIQLHGIRILAVDDEEDARLLLKAVLERAGATVDTAGSATEAMAALLEQAPDVLVSDIAMPGEDGISLIRRVRALPAHRGGNVPAAALTAYARTEERRDIMNAGYTMHLAKPLDAVAMVAAIATLTRF